MKCEVKLFIAGKVVTDVVEARDYQDARETALRRNSSTAQVISVNAIFPT